MKLLTSWDILHGETAEDKRPSGALYQPIQMCTMEEKDEDWVKANVDWLEDLGIRQLSLTYNKIIKRYELAAGVIDKNDYILSEERGDINDHNDISGNFLDLTDEQLPSAMELTFYPLIPTIINVLTGEFSKRYQQVQVQAVDQFSKNEKMEEKMEAIRQYSVNMAKMKLFNNLVSQGFQPQSQEELNQILSEIDQQATNLPEIQELFSKSYQSMVERWAQYQVKYDDQRFNMYEKENMAFADYLKQDSQFWHIDLREDDYNVELWNPANTFYHVSPDRKYISEGNYVGRITMMSIPDIIDTYREKLHEHDITNLEKVYYSINGAKSLPYGSRNEDYYDLTRGPNDQFPNDINIAKRTDSMSMSGLFNFFPGSGSGAHRTFEEFINLHGNSYDYPVARVTEVYWKSQKKLGYLTTINDEGVAETEVVTESYKITTPPLYDTTFYKKKDASSLIYGEHIEWFWINETWGGKKLDVSELLGMNGSVSNRTTGKGTIGHGQIYFDCGPLKFQFKGEMSLWDSKLPVEGIAKTDIRLPMGVSLVDKVTPYQIKYNIAGNQMKDIMLDERGTVVLMDQNTIPSNSMGEDWGQNNFAKVGWTMDQYGILPVDTSLVNLGERGQFSHFQTLNLEQSQRFASRIQIMEWCKNEALSTIGITPQRMGSVGSYETATGVQEAVNNSYSQTEMYFVEHINFLMPRVRNMMINAAQYYNATKPSVQLQFMNENEENVMFEIEGYKLLTRDLHVYTNFKPNSRAVLEQMKSIVLNNNTTNANIYDLLKVLSASTPAEIVNIAKQSVKDFERQQAAQNEQQSQMLQQQIQLQQEDQERQRNWESEENAKDRQKDVTVATIRSMGYANDTDINKNQTPDVLEIQKFNTEIGKFQENINLQKEKLSFDREKHRDTTRLKEREIEQRRQAEDKKLQIARENQTRAELEAKRKLKNDSKSKK